MEHFVLSKNIKVTPNKKEDHNKIINSVINLLEKNILMTLSTVSKDNRPCNSSAYYVFDNELNIYFWTDPNALHSKNIKNNPKVAVNIFNSSQEWGSLIRGLQIFGTANVVTKKELLNGGALYIKRFPKVLMYVKKILDFHSKELEQKMYKIEINKIKLLDEKTFGKEEYRELIIER